MKLLQYQTFYENGCACGPLASILLFFRPAARFTFPPPLPAPHESCPPFPPPLLSQHFSWMVPSLLEPSVRLMLKNAGILAAGCMYTHVNISKIPRFEQSAGCNTAALTLIAEECACLFVL